MTNDSTLTIEGLDDLKNPFPPHGADPEYDGVNGTVTYARKGDCSKLAYLHVVSSTLIRHPTQISLTTEL